MVLNHSSCPASVSLLSYWLVFPRAYRDCKKNWVSKNETFVEQLQSNVDLGFASCSIIQFWFDITWDCIRLLTTTSLPRRKSHWHPSPNSGPISSSSRPNALVISSLSSSHCMSMCKMRLLINSRQVESLPNFRLWYFALMAQDKSMEFRCLWRLCYVLGR